MTNALKRPIVVGGIVLAALMVFTALASGLALAGGNGKHWTAPLDGSQEVPAVDSNGTGVAKFKLSKDGTSISYKLNVANLDDVVQSHIHIAPAGVNGSVVVFLFGPAAGGVTVNGTLAEGTITAAQLVGPLVGADLADLVDEMNAGNAYVNVHTLANPGGEIRGQIK